MLADTSRPSFEGSALDGESSPLIVSGVAAMIEDGGMIVGDPIAHLSSPAAAKKSVMIGHGIMPFMGAVVMEGIMMHAGEYPCTVASTLLSFISRCIHGGPCDNLLNIETLRKMLRWERQF